MFEEFSDGEVLKRLAGPKLRTDINEAIHSLHVCLFSFKFMHYERMNVSRYEFCIAYYSWGLHRYQIKLRELLGLGSMSEYNGKRGEYFMRKVESGKRRVKTEKCKKRRVELKKKAQSHKVRTGHPAI